MLGEVDAAWNRGKWESAREDAATARESVPGLAEKLERIVLPVVSFSGLEMSRVVETLAGAATEFDRTGIGVRGVNIVLLDPGAEVPAVTLTLRNLSLKQILGFVAAAAGCIWEIRSDVVVVRPADEAPDVETRFFPVSRATVLRMTGRSTTTDQSRASGDLLTGAPGPGSPASAMAPVESESRALRTFLQQAGVDFDRTAGSSFAFDGSQLVITQTPRNLERLGELLQRYRNVRQVQIEAKFMEVQEGALEELGITWTAAGGPRDRLGLPSGYKTGGGVNRSLNEAFSFSSNNRTLEITSAGSTTLVNNGDGSQTPVTTPGVDLSLPTAPPVIPGGVGLGASGASIATLNTAAGSLDINAVVRALSQTSGTELLSAPRLTVLSGNLATITVAQEFRYPQSYGEIQSQVGTGSVNGGGSAGVSITSGTPREFATRNVGVELRVVPTVEEDDCSISLDLNPKVTEFEGFVEYGGPSVAISGGTTVTVPPGFYQPIFAVREVSTRVTIRDGATLVMGGLTREDVKKVKDKVPVLGSIPLLGRLFQSEGESTQKRNLLIFVTATLVDPGGLPTHSESAEIAADPALPDDPAQ